MSEETAKSTLKVLDASALDNLVETVDIDSDVSSFDRSDPLGDGQYRAQLTKPADATRLANFFRGDAFKSGENQGKQYFLVNFDLNIQEFIDPSLDSTILQGKQRKFPLVASSVIRHVNGKGTSEMLTILASLGVKFKGPTGLKQIVETFIQAIEAAPYVGVEMQLQGQIETDKKRKGSSDKNEWKTVLRGEKHFRNADGTFKHDLEVNGKAVYVKPVVVGYFPLSA